MSWNVLSVVGWGGILVGQTIQPAMPNLGALTQTGALGILAWVVWSQRQEQREARKQQHDDSIRLNETLTDLRVHCAKQQEAG